MSTDAVSTQGIPIWRGLVVAALAGATVVACLWASPPPSRSQAGIDMNLPDSLNGFKGSDQSVSASELAILPRDTEFAKKLYRNEWGDQISCQIVLPVAKGEASTVPKYAFRHRAGH